MSTQQHTHTPLRCLSTCCCARSCWTWWVAAISLIWKRKGILCVHLQLEDVTSLLLIKPAMKYAQLREVESMWAIARAHQNWNLANFEKALWDYKDGMSLYTPSDLICWPWLGSDRAKAGAWGGRNTNYATILRTSLSLPCRLSPYTACLYLWDEGQFWHTQVT